MKEAYNEYIEKEKVKLWYILTEKGVHYISD